MPTIQKESTLATATTLDNVWSGSAFEYPRQNSLMSMGLAGSATGLVATIQAGSRVVCEESPIMVLTTMPIIPDHFFYNEGILAGERLITKLRNTSGGTLTYRAICNLQPV